MNDKHACIGDSCTICAKTRKELWEKQEHITAYDIEIAKRLFDEFVTHVYCVDGFEEYGILDFPKWLDKKED